MQTIPNHILELKAASTEKVAFLHRNRDIFPEEKHVHLRSSQKKQRWPLMQGHLRVKSSLSRMEGDRCFRIPLALSVQWFVD